MWGEARTMWQKCASGINYDNIEDSRIHLLVIFNAMGPETAEALGAAEAKRKWLRDKAF
jgi:hypothetical protein